MQKRSFDLSNEFILAKKLGFATKEISEKHAIISEVIFLNIQEFGYEVEYNSKNILGIITAPREFDYSNCIIFCHGYNGNRIEDNRLTVKFARRLAQIGIMSYRFDFLGAGVSDGFFHEWTLNDRVLQGIEVIKQIRQHFEVSRLGIIGISDGCRVALDISSKVDGVNSVAIISPRLYNIDLPGNNLTSIKINKYKLKRSKLHGSIMPYDDAGVWIHPRYSENEGQYYNYLISNLLDRIRILTIFGGNDTCIPVSMENLNSIINRNFKVITIKDADHLYNSESWICELKEILESFFSQIFMKS
jgi:pimeloyl-ACP methyl ester carboxylesterase